MVNPNAEDTFKNYPQYEKAIEAYESDENDLAIKLIGELIQDENFPDKHVCHYILAQIFIEEENYKNALEELKIAASLGHIDASNTLIRIASDEKIELEEEEILLKKVLLS